MAEPIIRIEKCKECPYTDEENVQCAILKIIKTLDARIDLLQRLMYHTNINENPESTLRMFRLKTECNIYKEIRDLTCDRLEENEREEVIKSWVI